MIRRYCDRCDAAIAEKTSRISDKKTKTEYWIEKFQKGSAFHTEMDLCPECRKSFGVWLFTKDKEERG